MSSFSTADIDIVHIVKDVMVNIMAWVTHDNRMHGIYHPYSLCVILQY